MEGCDARSVSAMSTSTEMFSYGSGGAGSNVDVRFGASAADGGDDIPLVGRRWLLREVAQHLDAGLPTSGGFVVSGGPGTGKTAFAKRLVKGGGTMLPYQLFRMTFSLQL